MKRLLAALLLVLASRAECQIIQFTKLPCDPVFIAGNQGRPLPQSVVTVVSTLTGLPVTVFGDPLGTAFNGTVPPSQILQVFTSDAGTYSVLVTSSGTVKQYYIHCGQFTAGAQLVSVDYLADQLVPAAADCSTEDVPCVVNYPKGDVVRENVFLLMPSFPTSLSSATWVWRVQSDAGGQVVWQLDWCKDQPGDPVCILTHTETFVSFGRVIGGGPFTRVDLTVPVSSFSLNPGWSPNDGVSMGLTRGITDGRDNLQDTAFLEHFRLEFSR